MPPTNRRQPIRTPPEPPPLPSVPWAFRAGWTEADEDREGRDELEVTPRAATVLGPDGPVGVIEVTLSTPSAGPLAVFRPSESDLADGEGDLAAEHLRREAESLREEVARTRRAFRTAFTPASPPRLLRPFFAPVRVEDGLRLPAASVTRPLVGLGLGTGVGVGAVALGGESSLLAMVGAGVSLLIMGYAFAGLWLGERHRSDFERTAGLPVLIRKVRV